MADAKKLTEIFKSLAPLERWVPWVAIPSKTRPGKTDKVPGTKARKLSTSNPEHWFTLEQASEHGPVGLVMTGGIQQNGCTLLGFDVDGAGKNFQFPLSTYVEISPSGKGLRAFAWCPTPWLDTYQDCTNAKADHCEHVETYFGSAPRFLTVTFDPLNEYEIAFLDENQFEEITPFLKKKDTLHTDHSQAPKTDGIPIDLSKLKLSEKHQRLIKNEIKPGNQERHPIVHSLLLKLFEANNTVEDIKATCMSPSLYPGLWEFFNKHGDPVKFIDSEINRAYPKSTAATKDALASLGEILKKKQPKDQKQPEPAQAFELKDRPLTLALLKTPLPPREFVIDPHLPAKVMVEFSGGHGISKSTLALDIVCRIAAGLQWCGLPTKKGKSVFLSREDSYDDVLGRVQKWIGAQDREMRDQVSKRLCENLQILGREDTRGLVLTSKAFGECAANQDLVDYVSEKYKGNDLIILETMSRLHGGDELNEDLATFADALEEIAERTGACVLVIRHVSKSAAVNKDTGSYVGRGGGSFSDAARSVLTMVEMDPDELNKKGIALDGLAAAVDGKILMLDHSKSNYTRRYEPLFFLRLDGGVLQEVKAPNAIDEFGKRLLEYLKGFNEALTLRQITLDLDRHKVPKHRIKGILDSLVTSGAATTERVRRTTGMYDAWRAAGRPGLI